MDRKEESRTRIYSFSDRLVVKTIGKSDWIQRFISDLHKIYPANSMNFSPILKDRGADSFHCFINILMEPEEP